MTSAGVLDSPLSTGVHLSGAAADLTLVRRSRNELMDEAGISGFVDLHCHLLPGLDDGPAEAQLSSRMAERAMRSGTLAIIATPHSSSRYKFSVENRDREMNEMLRSLRGRIDIFTGCEVELSPEGLVPVWHDPAAAAINRGPYLLVEAPTYGFASSLNVAIPRLRELRLRPILAHPERLAADNRNVAIAARRDGLLFQVTAGALTGAMGARIQRVAWKLLEQGVVEFIASDGHDSTRRPPDLAPAFHLTACRFGPAAAADLFTWNPLAVLGQAEPNASATATSGS